MIHPHTELRKINDHIGVGVFATAYIPRGTLTYVFDPLEIELSETAFSALPEPIRQLADKYCYVDAKGLRVVSWDLAKYINHRCDCNTLSSGWGFEIALRDIQPGEEITDDYGLFNLAREMPVTCNCPNCRLVVRPDDLDRFYELWDAQIKEVLPKMLEVEQPLLPYLEPEVYADTVRYLAGKGPYTSVQVLKCERAFV